jgi:hypothetical protein
MECQPVESGVYRASVPVKVIDAVGDGGPTRLTRRGVKLTVPLPDAEAKRPVPPLTLHGTISPPKSNASCPPVSPPLSHNVAPFFFVKTTSSSVKHMGSEEKGPWSSSQPESQSALNETRPTPETVPTPSTRPKSPRSTNRRRW